MAFVITSECITERAADCVEVCPVDCITIGDDQFLIDPNTCIDCGACVVVCPVEAIYFMMCRKRNWHQFLKQKNTLELHSSWKNFN